MSNTARKQPPPGRWALQDAKSHLSELIRLVHSHGPQHVMVHGRDEVVVIGVDEYRRLQGRRTGQALIDALRASPHRDVEIDVARPGAMPVRDVDL